MVAFALSCFGILIFLWLSFGGSVPLQPQGYRVTVAFPEATQLAQEADVRISGVPVGRVKKKEPNEETGLTDTEIEIDARYAPIPRTRARSCARRRCSARPTWSCHRARPAPAACRPTAAGCRPARCAETVELDEILRTFDPVTRERFSTWLDQAGQGGPRERRGAQRRARPAHPVRRGDRRRARGAARPGRRHAPLHPRHRRGVRRADRAQRPAARPDLELEPRLGGGRRAATSSSPTPSGSCPPSCARDADHRAPDAVRRGHRSADHAAAAGRARSCRPR